MVVEGAVDAWRVGAKHAVAISGCSFSLYQLADLSLWARGVMASDATPELVVLLDNDAQPRDSKEKRDRLRARAARVDNAMLQIRDHCAGSVIAHRLRLPPGSDPGSMTRTAVWELIAEARTSRADENVRAPRPAKSR